MNTVKVYAKAIAAFVAGVVANMIVNLVNGSTPWPHTGNEWLQYGLTSLGAAIAALAVRNKITQKQLDADPHVVGGTVVDTPPPPENTTTYTNPFRK